MRREKSYRFRWNGGNNMILNFNFGGVDTSDATADAGKILYPYTAYKDGEKVTGSIPSLAAQTITPGTADQIIASGQYLAGAQTIKGLPYYGAQTITPGTSDIVLAQGRLLSGAQTIKGDANLIPDNIISGKNIFGVSGGASSAKFRSAQASYSGTTLTITSAEDISNFICIYASWQNSNGDNCFVFSLNAPDHVVDIDNSMGGTMYYSFLASKEAYTHSVVFHCRSDISVSGPGIYVAIIA